jgi:hypothetical protein
MSDSVLSFNMLSDYAVRGVDGKVDFDATIEKFSTRLIEFESLCEKEDEAIGAAVHNVFDTKVAAGAPLSMDSIVTFAIVNLNPNAENFKILSDRIKSWVRINSDQPEKKDENDVVLAVAEPARTRAFYIKKGLRGGVRRWADVPVKPAAE